MQTAQQFTQADYMPMTGKTVAMPYSNVSTVELNASFHNFFHNPSMPPPSIIPQISLTMRQTVPQEFLIPPPAVQQLKSTLSESSIDWSKFSVPPPPIKQTPKEPYIDWELLKHPPPQTPTSIYNLAKYRGLEVNSPHEVDLQKFTLKISKINEIKSISDQAEEPVFRYLHTNKNHTMCQTNNWSKFSVPPPPIIQIPEKPYIDWELLKYPPPQTPMAIYNLAKLRGLEVNSPNEVDPQKCKLKISKVNEIKSIWDQAEEPVHRYLRTNNNHVTCQMNNRSKFSVPPPPKIQIPEKPYIDWELFKHPPPRGLEVNSPNEVDAQKCTIKISKINEIKSISDQVEEPVLGYHRTIKNHKTCKTNNHHSIWGDLDQLKGSLFDICSIDANSLNDLVPITEKVLTFLNDYKQYLEEQNEKNSFDCKLIPDATGI